MRGPVRRRQHFRVGRDSGASPRWSSLSLSAWCRARDAGSPPGGAGARGVYRHPNGIAVGLGRGERHWVHRRRSASGVARPVMNSEHPGPTRRRPPRPPHRTSHCHFHCHPRRSRRRGTARQTQKPLRRAASGRWALLGSDQRPPACRAEKTVTTSDDGRRRRTRFPTPHAGLRPTGPHGQAEPVRVADVAAT
jgi:hypothetical protein